MRFDQKAGSYHRNATIQARVAAWGSEWIEAEVSAFDALEFGAGTGLFTERLAQAGFRTLMATDRSERMVMEGGYRVPSASWSVVDAWNPEIAGSVDRIYATSLLQWAPDPVAALSCWRELLRPGGRVLACIFVLGTMAEILAVDASASALPWRSARAWENAFAEAGFRVQRSETRLDVVRHANALAAFRSLHATGAVEAKRFGTGRLRGLLSRIDRRFREIGVVPMSWSTLRIEAEL